VLAAGRAGDEGSLDEGEGLEAVGGLDARVVLGGEQACEDGAEGARVVLWVGKGEVRSEE
jgi:hypothetical protein